MRVSDKTQLFFLRSVFGINRSRYTRIYPFLTRQQYLYHSHMNHLQNAYREWALSPY